MERAAADLEALTSSLPDELDAHYHLAEANRLLNRMASAKEEAERALEIDPTFVPAKALLRQIGTEMGERGSPAASREEDRTDWGSAWLEAHEARGRRKAAVAAYDRLIAICEQGREPYIGLTDETYLARGAACLGLGDFEGAQEDFAVVCSRAPGSFEPELLLGKAYLLAGKKEQAGKVFLRLHENHDRAEEAALWIALVYGTAGEQREALQWVAKVDRQGIRERLRAYFLVQLQDWDKAAEAGRGAVRADPESSGTQLLLASALLGKIARGGESVANPAVELAGACRRALELDPDGGYARLLLRRAWEMVHRRNQGSSSKGDIMKAREVLIAAALAAGFALDSAGPVRAREIIDDFEDGDVADGRPVSWQSCPWCCPGNRRIEEGNLIIENTSGQNFHQYMRLDENWSGDASFRTLATFDGAPDNSWTAILMYKNDDSCCGVYAASVRSDGFYGIWRFDIGACGANGLSTGFVADFDPHEDYFLQVDSIADILEFRVWRSGEPMPALGVTARDATYRSGTFGFVFNAGRARGSCRGVFRFAHLADTPIRDPSPEAAFLRGECNGDEKIDIADPVFNLNYQFANGAEPPCLKAADVNDDGMIDLADAVFELNYLFASGPVPPAPLAECGPDPTADEITCDSYRTCE